MSDTINQDIVESIRDFIKDRLGKKIDQNTVFFSDLELIGIDADQFILEFSEKFSVDFENFVFEDYFHEVSSIPFAYWFMKKYKPSKFQKNTFDLDHLASVVKKGYWYSPH